MGILQLQSEEVTDNMSTPQSNNKIDLYLIYSDSSEAGSMETLPDTQGLQALEYKELQQSDLTFTAEDKICITTEACLDLVLERMTNEEIKKSIEVLKDKYKFRQLIKPLFPDYFYQKIPFDQIKSLQVKEKSVLKPQKGCFGTGVRILSPDQDMAFVSKDVRNEISRNSDVLSEEVLSKDDFILEKYIDGEEYAVDMFFDHLGKPHIANIYHHPIPENTFYLHMIYYSSNEVFQRLYKKAIEFYSKLNESLSLKNILLHGEFRYTNENQLFPIEINPMRFGGMGLGNMIYYTMNINPYEYFIRNQSPPWKELWSNQNRSDNIYAFFIAYNGRNIDKSTHEPDIEKLCSEFSEVLNSCIFNYKEQLAFGTFIIRENSKNLKKLLKIDFDNYFKPIATTDKG